jgi:peptidyl-prolyl cis-trans isomerase B (cyclophilin B)
MSVTPESPKANPVVNLETSLGLIRLELWPEAAPITVANFLSYVREGFYDGLIFHRVVRYFIAQAGGFEPGMAYRAPTHPPIKNEAAHGKQNRRGTVAMARAYPIDSAAAQFFINLADNPALNHHGPEPQVYGYTVFGRVLEGEQILEKFSQVPVESRDQHRDVPVEDIVLKRAWVEGEG